MATLYKITFNMLHLYTVDPATGDETFVADITTTGNFAGAASARGRELFVSWASGDSFLGKLDLDTLAWTEIGTMDLGGPPIDAIAFIGNTLYAARGGSATTSDLYTVDTDTAVITPIGPIGYALTGLAYDESTDTFYGATSNNSATDKRKLITVDPLTGAGTVIGPFNLVGAPHNTAADLACDPDGNLYGWSSFDPPGLFTINKATGQGTGLGATPDSVGAGFAFAADPVPDLPPHPTAPYGRFYESPEWRFIVTDLEHATLTFLDRRAMDRSVTVHRNAAREIQLRVPSDDPEVNIANAGSDTDPFVSEGDRFLLGFRREGGTKKWRIRASTLLLGIEDAGDESHSTSSLHGFDPWKYFYRRPVLLSDGSLPAEEGRVYAAGTRASEIISEQLQLAIDHGSSIFTDFGQTAFYAGTIEPTDPLPNGGDGLAITFQRGTSLGEMLDVLVATGTCDIVLDPIYDPTSRPGILCELSVYKRAGDFKPDAILGWDKYPRNVVGLSRGIAGDERANLMQMYAGQGGPPVPLETDPPSIAKYGDYYSFQYLVGVNSISAAHAIARRQLELLREGQVTYTLTLAGERAPLLFQEYRESDTLELHASRRLRDPVLGAILRVESIPITIDDNQLERVEQLLVSVDPAGGS